MKYVGWCVLFFLVGGCCGSAIAQAPKVAVDVAVATLQGQQDDQPVLPDDFGKAAQTVAAKWTFPVEPVAVPEVPLPGVTLYTADGDWCAPCKKQLKILIDAGGMTADGQPIWLFRVVKTNQRTVPQWVPDSAPDKAMTGYREATSLKKWIDSYAKKSVSSNGRTTKAELDLWVRANYKPDTLLDTDVSPRSNVWNHLTDGTGGTHVFTADQVTGLEQWVALALHNEIHKDSPGILPVKSVSATKSPDLWAVDVDGSDSRYIVAALAEAVRSHDDTRPAVQGFLPVLPVDINDDLLKVLDALVGKDGYAGEGFSVKWPAGKRRVSFEPGISLTVRKVLEVDVTIKAIEVDGRTVTLTLDGVFLKQLTVRLK